MSAGSRVRAGAWRAFALALGWVAVATGLVSATRAESPLDALRPGEWYEVPNSALRAVLPVPKAPGDPGAITGAWNGATYDPVRDALILAANGGHTDYGGNEVYAFSLASLSWQRLTDPSPAPLPQQGQEELPDGKPASRHTYSGVTFLGNVDKVFITGGSLWSEDGRGSKGAWTFDVPSRTWQRRADAPGGQVTAMAAYDPVSGLAFSLLQYGTLAAYDPVKNKWSGRANINWAGFDPARTMVLHPKRRMLLVVGGGEVFGFDLGSFFSGRRDLATTGGDPIVKAQGPGLAYDPVADRIVGWAGGGDVYSLDLRTRTWTRYPPLGDRVPGEAPHQGTFGRWQYVPSKDLFIGVNSIDENVWLYRPVRPAAARPSPGSRRPGACPAGDCIRPMADAGDPSPAPRTERPVTPLDLPDRTWVSRPLPSGFDGPGLRPYGSKHTRLLYDAKRGRMVLTGGDYPNPYISDNGSQMVWAMDLASGPAPTWTLIGPWCNGPEQPGRPDTVVWAYDAKRDQGVIMPGFYFITQRDGSECPGVTDLADAMVFDFATHKWRRPPFGPPPGGYGGDLGGSFGVYDPPSDAIYRFRWTGAGNVMEILSLERNRWSVIGVGGASSLNRDQSVIDVEGRSIYAISRRPRGLLRYAIAKRRVEVIALPAQAPVPGEGQEDLETHLAFDPVNRVVLYPSAGNNGGRILGLGIYHVDTGRWEWEAVPSGSPAVQGNVVGFDTGHNAMLLYGGKDSDDVDLPTVFWLYRYGPGAPTPRP